MGHQIVVNISRRQPVDVIRQLSLYRMGEVSCTYEARLVASFKSFVFVIVHWIYNLIHIHYKYVHKKKELDIKRLEHEPLPMCVQNTVLFLQYLLIQGGRSYIVKNNKSVLMSRQVG